MLIVLIIIQFIRPEKNISATLSENDITTKYDVPEDVKIILSKACNDCHSNNTNYPWYSRVQPVGWFLENHINKGKEELNFSEFGSYSSRKQLSKLTSMISQVEDDKMPLPSYTFIHHEARLSAENKKTLIEYFKELKESL